MALGFIALIDWRYIEKKYNIEQLIAVTMVDTLFSNQGFKSILSGHLYVKKTFFCIIGWKFISG